MTQIVISTSGKGGSGKTIAARMIAEMIEMKGHRLTVFDGDMFNPTTLSVFENRDGVTATGVDVRNPDDVARMTKEIEAAPESAIFLLDLPVGAGEYLAEKTEMFRGLAARKNNLQIDIVWSINLCESSVVNMAGILNAFKGLPVRFTVAKNEFYATFDGRPRPFQVWEQSAIRKNLIESHTLTETSIPAIRQKLMDGLGNRSIAKVVNRETEVEFYLRARFQQISKEIEQSFGHLVPEKNHDGY